MVMEIDDKVTAANGQATMVIRVWTEPGDERGLKLLGNPSVKRD
jgi:hypothetical protein